MAGENDGAVVAPAASDGEGDGGPVSTNDVGTGGVVVMPAAALQALLAGATGAKTRLEGLIAQLTAATPDEAAEVPSEPLMVLADIANMIAATIMPYVLSDGMVGAEDAAVAMAEQEKAAAAAPPPVPGAAPAAAVTKALLTWTQEYIDSLSDYCFLYVEPSTTHDNDWHTLPLSNRHFPIRDHACRLSLPAVMDAIEAIRGSSAPWLSEPKKRSMLLRIADERLCEAMIVVRREANVPPEIIAELASIAELISTVCPVAGVPTPAAVAPGAAVPPPATGGAPAPIAQAAATPFGEVTAKALSNLRKMVLAKSEAGGGAWDDARGAKMAGAVETLTKAMAGVTEVIGGAPAAQAKAGDVVASPDLTAKVDELAKSVKELKVALGKSEQNASSLKSTIAKMARETPPSGQVRDDKVEVVTKGDKTPPLSSNLNDLIAAETEAPKLGDR